MSSEIPEESRGASSSIDQSVGSLLNQPLVLAVLFGFLLLALAAIRRDGTVAGMLGIYGATVLVVSIGIYAVLSVLRRNQ